MTSTALSNSELTTAIPPLPNTPLTTPAIGTGLRAQYYDNRDLTNLKFTRIDQTVDFNWKTAAPISQMGVDTFSVRWTGQVQAQFSERYTFFTRADDGVRLWVDGKLMIDRWTNQAVREDQGSIELKAGQRYNIRLEYYENTRKATCSLLWASASQVKQLIPTSALFDSMVSSDTYTFSGSDLLKNGQPFQMRGVNAMHVFGSDSFAMKGWGINTVREFIGDFKNVPITGAPTQSNGTWLHSLNTIVQNNRANNMVTIFTPFGWDGTEATMFTGKNPTETPWWKDYLARFQQVASAFKDQSDVWLGVWNEPYTWNRVNYSDEQWLSDMKVMIENIQAVAPRNMLVIPGAEQGQDEKIFLKYGQTLLKQYSNLVFDVHAYEKWLVQPQSTIESRIKTLKDAGLPVVFGEVGPQNASHLIDPKPFLNAARAQKTNVLAWVWKTQIDAFDSNALRKADGTLNNQNNFDWSTAVQRFLKDL